MSHDQSSQSNAFGKAVSSSGAFRAIGIASGALSLISIGARTFEVGLSGVFADLVTFVRAFTHALFGLLPKLLLNIDIPQNISDLWALSFMGTGALMYARQRIGEDDNSGGIWTRVLFFLSVGLTMGGVAYFLLALLAVPLFLIHRWMSSAAGKPEPWTGTDAVYQETASWIVIAVCAALLFFALNAFAPGL